MTDTASSIAPKTAGTAEAEGRCRACVHSWDRHDVIGKRFCTATIARDLPRGCACG